MQLRHGDPWTRRPYLASDADWHIIDDNLTDRKGQKGNGSDATDTKGVKLQPQEGEHADLPVQGAGLPRLSFQQLERATRDRQKTHV